jgi:voltage-gated potassium channel
VFTLKLGVVDAFVFTVDTLAYLTSRQTGAAWVVQVVQLHGGTIITWYIGWYLVDLVLERHPVRHLEDKRLMRQLSELSDHVVICGGGRVRAELAALLTSVQSPFVVVDVDPERACELRARGHLVVEGDARLPETLMRAGIARASKVVVTLPSAERGVLVVLAAVSAHERIHVEARCEDESLAQRLPPAGAKRVIVPERACAEAFMRSVPGIEGAGA